MHATERCASLLGRAIGDVEGRSATEWIHPDDVDAALAASRKMAASRASRSYLRRFIRSDGHILSVLGDLVPLEVGVGVTQIICRVRVLALPAGKSLDGAAVQVADSIAALSRDLGDFAHRAGLISLSDRLAEVSIKARR